MKITNLLSLIMATLLLPVPSALSQRAGQITNYVARFQRQLEQSGYTNQPGSEASSDFNQWYCQSNLFSAVWANPQASYIATRLPEVPGQAPNLNAPVNWRLRQDEAVVLIGLTPPPMAYFSFDFTMLNGRLSTGPLLWVSVGDPINHMTVRTIGPTAFDRPFALVITGNRRTQSEVNGMLAAAGLGGAINNMTIPAAMFQLGLDADSDEFFLGMRPAVPDPGFEQAVTNYRAAPPLQVFRVRPKNPSGDESQPVFAPDPLPVPPLRLSGTGTTELDLNPTLQLLRQRIIDAFPGYTAQDVRLERAFVESYPGLQTDSVIYPPIQGVGGYSYDATYLMTAPITLADGSFLVAYGANHVATGKASYTSDSVYADANAGLFLATKNHRELQGTARDFIADQQNADMFYAWTFSRAGNSGPQGPHVTPLLPTNTCYCEPYGTSRPVDMSTVQLLDRIYAEPATKTRPALSELLLDRLLLFTPK